MCFFMWFFLLISISHSLYSPYVTPTTNHPLGARHLKNGGGRESFQRMVQRIERPHSLSYQIEILRDGFKMFSQPQDVKLYFSILKNNMKKADMVTRLNQQDFIPWLNQQDFVIRLLIRKESCYQGIYTML